MVGGPFFKNFLEKVPSLQLPSRFHVDVDLVEILVVRYGSRALEKSSHRVCRIELCILWTTGVQILIMELQWTRVGRDFWNEELCFKRKASQLSLRLLRLK
jgi:hypothetical protein